MIRLSMILAAALVLGGCESFPQSFRDAVRPVSSTPRPAATPATAAAPAPLTVAYSPNAEQQLLDLERRLAGTAQERGLGTALGSVIDLGDGFVLRPGELLQGPEAIQAALNGNAGSPILWQPDRVFVSGAGDMGVTSGRYVQVVPGAEALQGRYLAVWRKDPTGEWRLLSESRVADPRRAAPTAPTRRR
ncbi:MAG: nuclear transport factor 2 family protein [Terricaulis sp.]